MSTSETFSFRIADRLAGVDSSPVRDLLEVVSKEGVISFAGGVPDPDYFEVEDVRAAYAWVFENQPQRALQYASSEGEPELREQAARRISRDLPTTADQIQVTTGSQEGLFVVAQALVNPGTPSWWSAPRTSRRCRPSTSTARTWWASPRTSTVCCRTSSSG